jgi:hypothetical protein
MIVKNLGIFAGTMFKFLLELGQIWRRFSIGKGKVKDLYIPIKDSGLHIIYCLSPNIIAVDMVPHKNVTPKVRDNASVNVHIILDVAPPNQVTKMKATCLISASITIITRELVKYSTEFSRQT